LIELVLKSVLRTEESETWLGEDGQIGATVSSAVNFLHNPVDNNVFACHNHSITWVTIGSLITMAKLQGQAKADYVQRMFDEIAPSYDRGNRVMSLGQDMSWRRIAIRTAALPAGGAALDIGAGTGDMAFLLAPHAGTVVGIDFAPNMVALAQRKARSRESWRHVSFLLADALHLPFPDDGFHAVTIAFAIRNVADIRRGLSEMQRVLAPGGRIVCLEFVKPNSRFVRNGYFTFLRLALPTLGRLSGGRPESHRYLAESIKDFYTADDLRLMMREAGFTSVRSKGLNWGTVAVVSGVKDERSKVAHDRNDS